MENEFFVDCLGASREVGRSAFMLHTDKNIILDYGVKIFDESGVPKYPLPDSLKPDFMILSHAHMDHSGALPSLYKENKIRWYATPPTKDICEVLWQDSMKIMGPELPYNLSHYNKALKYWSPFLYNQTMHTGQTSIRLTDGGHISGSSMVDIEYKNKRFFYTGDFKCEDTYMHKGAKTVKDVDILMMESTYAKKDHPPRQETERRFMEEIETTIEDGGNVLLPSFALGRTQELISIIRSHNREVPVFVDGMGRTLSQIYLKHPQYIRDAQQFRKHAGSVTMVGGPGDRRAATRKPSVIISSAGMMNGGPVLQYLFNLNDRSKIIFTGYCVEGTNGWKLQNHGYITKDEQDLHVDLPIEYMDFSAHAGRSDI
ncbi:MBL fold metallo-hydrolase, partial [Candidatus Micrarchaeota archaeon]|nr:MBL fold metallo-hydrolase [Candidatus Micrarchaeota archaeon]